MYKATRVAILNEDRSAANGGVFLGAETDVASGYYKGKAVKAATGSSENDYYGTVTTATEVIESNGKVTNTATEVATVKVLVLEKLVMVRLQSIISEFGSKVRT